MRKDRKYTAEDLNRILDRVYIHADDKESSGYTLEEILSAAQDTGVSKQTVIDTITEIEEEKARNAKKLRRYLRLGIAVLILGGLILFFNWPHRFSGRVKMTLSSLVDDDFNPRDDLKELDLFSLKEVYSLLTFYDIRTEYLVTWELCREEVFIDKHTIQLHDVGNPHFAYATFFLPLDLLPGTYRFQVFAGKELIMEKEVALGLGELDIILCRDINENNKPVDLKESFSKQSGDFVTCYLYFYKLSRGDRVEWYWKKPDGSLQSISNLAIEPSGSSYWAYAALNTVGKKSGNWLVEIYLDSYKIGVKGFEIND